MARSPVQIGQAFTARFGVPNLPSPYDSLLRPGGMYAQAHLQPQTSRVDEINRPSSGISPLITAQAYDAAMQGNPFINCNIIDVTIYPVISVKIVQNLYR